MPGEGWEAVLPPLLEAAGLPMLVRVEALTGGVSSDIVAVHLNDGRVVCAKRALPRLKVASVWEAPLERNHYELEYLRLAAGIAPGVAPKVLAEDRARGIGLLEYLPAERFKLWKAELLAGHVDPSVAAAVGDAVGRIHAATFESPTVAALFPTDDLFDALRLDPYLRTTAARVPELAEPILAVVAVTAGTRQALVHGDVSPKNILVDRLTGQPVLLDAECAWYGDPAFDAAFLLNHLLLKALHLPAVRAALLAAAADFRDAWLGAFHQGLATGAERRCAALLPCLFLARIDGKSPVEYLDESERQRARTVVAPLIREPSQSLGEVFAHLERELGAD